MPLSNQQCFMSGGVYPPVGTTGPRCRHRFCLRGRRTRRSRCACAFSMCPVPGAGGLRSGCAAAGARALHGARHQHQRLDGRHARGCSAPDALFYPHRAARVRGRMGLTHRSPAELRAEVEACQNTGTWPVLVGEQGDRGTMLAAPTILGDYPEIAPESPRELFDSKEIDHLVADDPCDHLIGVSLSSASSALRSVRGA